MAYTKHDWVCGETITADLLNNLEGGVEEALECCGSGGGFSCTETREVLAEEALTTEDDEGLAVAYFSELESISSNTIAVTIDGVEYECEVRTDDAGNYYGAPWNDSSENYDWSEYPFAVWNDRPTGVSIAFENAGTYAIKVEAINVSVETSECFEKAVNSISPEPMILTLGGTTQEEADDAIANGAKLSETWETINEAFGIGRRVIAEMNPYLAKMLSNAENGSFVTEVLAVGNGGTTGSMLFTGPTVVIQWAQGQRFLVATSTTDYPKTSGMTIG